MARIQSVPEPLDLDLYNQDTFALTMQFSESYINGEGQKIKQVMNISGWIFTAAWKPNKNDPRIVPWTFVERENSTGTIALYINADMFTAMKAISPSGVWDLQIVFPDNSKQTMLGGYVYTDADVTP